MAGTIIKTDEVRPVLHSILPKKHELQKETEESLDAKYVDLITEDESTDESRSFEEDRLHKDRQLDTEQNMDDKIFLEPTGTDRRELNNSTVEEPGEAEVSKLLEAKNISMIQIGNVSGTNTSKVVACKTEHGPFKKQKLTHDNWIQCNEENLKGTELKTNVESKLEPADTSFETKDLHNTNVGIQNSDTDKRNHTWTEDENIWKNCFKNKQKFDDEAKKLLQRGILPGEKIMSQIYQFYGRKSAIVQQICKGICQYILEMSNNITEVWPAYEYTKGLSCKENRITFVVITKLHTSINVNYRIYQRNVNEISARNKEENQEISQKNDLGSVINDDVKSCLKSNATKLMDSHRKLTWVTACGVRASGYGHNSGRRIDKVTCIALYVQIKGLIPLNEEPFKETLDGIQVDVREGVFTLCGTSTDLHQHVRTGCAVDSGYGTNQGTVGPFFQYESDCHTYLLTSAHVLLKPKQMKRLTVQNQINYGYFGNDTYQPPESISVKNNVRHPLGKTDLAVYRTGGNGRSGMEVALVRIDENRCPQTWKLPDDSLSKMDEYGIKDGLNLPITKINDLKDLSNPTVVYKYGSATGLTKGLVQFCGSSFRTNTLQHDGTGFEIVLHEQIEIQSMDGLEFGGQGDSGALVFVRDNNGFSALGIVEGQVNGMNIVSPLSDIKTALQETMSRIRDPPNRQAMDIEEFNQVAIPLFYDPSVVHRSLIAPLNRAVNADSNAYTTEIQSNILQHTEHKIDSVKSELTSLKTYIEASTNTITQNIERMETMLSGNITRVSEQLNVVLNKLSHGTTLNFHH